MKQFTPEQSYKEEVITIIMPSNTNSNHIFNENKFDILPTYDSDKNKIIILRNKVLESPVIKSKVNNSNTK